MLDRFLAVKKAEVAALVELARRGALPQPLKSPRPSFSGALVRATEKARAQDGAAAPRLPLAVIAEYKRASPSRGRICGTLSPEAVARSYAAGGAAAMSVLTEEVFFEGRMDYLERAAAGASEAGRKLPLLRKDFICDPLQVEATAATPASAMLLIVRLTPDPRMLRRLREQAEGYGIECVVEVFGEADLALARESGARIVQVNARDLDTLAVDREGCLRLIDSCPPERGEIWIAASGMERREHLAAAAEAGFTAALVGTALMRDGAPEAALRALALDSD